MKLLMKQLNTPRATEAAIPFARSRPQVMTCTAFLAAITLPACSVRYGLEGHDTPGLALSKEAGHFGTSIELAPMELAPGEERLALSQGLFPPREQRLLNLASEDPGVADVFYHRDAPSTGRIHLLGIGPGRTRVHYGILANQVAPFAGEESVRIGAPLPGIHTGSGVDPKDRVQWLRKRSLGSFEVIVR